MVKFAVEFWWKMLLTIFPAKEARKSPAKLLGESGKLRDKFSRVLQFRDFAAESGAGKGKSAANLVSPLPWTLPPPPVGCVS